MKIVKGWFQKKGQLSDFLTILSLSATMSGLAKAEDKFLHDDEVLNCSQDTENHTKSLILHNLFHAVISLQVSNKNF